MNDSLVLDIGLWPENIEELIDYWIKVGSSNLQNCNEQLIIEKSNKQNYNNFTHKNFNRKTANGEIIKRSWLCFSPSHGSVYCFVCKLMSNTRTQFTHGGFCDWKHVNARLLAHKTSKGHLNCVVTLAFRSKELGRIDTDLEKQTEQITNY